jgi:hypothetical protein
MATKTWKIGEYCKGGAITAIVENNDITIIAKEYDTMEEWDRIEVSSKDMGARDYVLNYLRDLTTSYYSGLVMDWIEDKVEFNPWV